MTRHSTTFSHLVSSFPCLFSTQSRLLRELSCEPTVDQCLVKNDTRSKEISRSSHGGAVCRGRRGEGSLFVQWQQKSTMATSQCLTRILEADVGSNREVVETVRFRRNSSSSFHWIRYWHRGRCFVFALTRAVFV